MEEPEKFSVKELCENKGFLEKIRWDVTPKILFKPRFPLAETEPYDIEGFMFYVDVINKEPALVIMRNRGPVSKTAGYVEGVPEDLLLEAMNCAQGECIAGMYPITKKLEDWLKKELGLS